MAESIWLWISDNVFSVQVFWIAVGLLTLAAIRDAYEAWKADLPWFGWDLRRKKRSSFTNAD
jgi:hypothetical protein